MTRLIPPGSCWFLGNAVPLGDDDDIWEAALEVAIKQAEDQADLLDLNFDSPHVDSSEAPWDHRESLTSHGV